MKLWRWINKLWEWFKGKKTVTIDPCDTTATAHASSKFISKYERNRRKYDKFLSIPRGKGHERKATGPKIKKEVIKEEAIKVDEESKPIVHRDKDGDLVEIKRNEIDGVFNFRDTILSQLDRYFYYIKRMKKADRDAYNYYKRVGATLTPYASYALDRLEMEFNDKTPEELDAEGFVWGDDVDHGAVFVSPYFLETLPTFSCIAYGADPMAERMEQLKKNKLIRWIPKFIYFEKLKKATADVQPFGGVAVYRVTIYWDRSADDKLEKKTDHGTPQQFMIGITTKGRIEALKIHAPEFITIKGKIRQRGQKDSNFHRGQWHYPDYFTRGKGVTRQWIMERIFSDATKWHEGSTTKAGFRISLKKGNHTATFCLDAERSAYFFADRDLIVDENGRKRRIFHIVKPHKRTLANGEKLDIKIHYRGLRKFSWAGYEVLITVPGLHHIDLSTFNEPGDPEAKKGMRLKEVGKIFADIIEGKEMNDENLHHH